MKYIDTYNDKFIVLTFGRTGSILLCRNIERNFIENPKYQTNDLALLPTMKAITDHSDLEFTFPVTILQSHKFFSRQNLVDYQPIFSIRKDYVEQILSMYFTEKFNKFHLLSEDSPMQIDLFEFKNWSSLENICRSWVSWHQHYAAIINKNDLVIAYEEFVSRLGPNQLQKQIYPDKEKCIKNYQQVKDFIESKTIKECHKMTAGHNNLLDKFIKHSNKFDIYPFIT
jgi:hypothetical protein